MNDNDGVLVEIDRFWFVGEEGFRVISGTDFYIRIFKFANSKVVRDSNTRHTFRGGTGASSDSSTTELHVSLPRKSFIAGRISASVFTHRYSWCWKWLKIHLS
jgi:hypothetical protein